MPLLLRGVLHVLTNLPALVPVCCLAAATILCGCTQFDILNATIPSCGYRRTSDIAYASLPRQKLDVYVPRKLAADAPVVVFFYGGHWQSGEKSDYRLVAEALAGQGCIAVMPNYRLYPQVTFPEFVRDGALAVRWTHDHIADFRGDPRRLFIMGHSAGGQIVALLALDKQYLTRVGLDRTAIRGAVGLSGPYDFVPVPYDRPVFSMSPGDITPSPDIEAINFVDGAAPPLLLVTGLDDKTVQPGNALRLAEKIRAAAGNVQLITYKGVGHVGVVLSFAWPFRWIAPTLRDTVRFFRANAVK